MSNKIINLTLLGLLGATNPAVAEVAPYVGVAASWDHLSGKRSESLLDYLGSNLIFSNNKSISDNKVNGYGFFGVSFNFKDTSLFFGPEIQLGQGSVSNKLNVTLNTQGFGNLIPRNPAAEISRKFTSSLAMRFGGNINKCSHLYGLGGIDLARYNYKYTWELIDTGNELITSYQTREYKKWRVAPLVGFGFEKTVSRHFKIGTEFRMSFYKSIKIHQSFSHTVAETDTAKTSIKPRVSSLMLRAVYVL